MLHKISFKSKKLTLKPVFMVFSVKEFFVFNATTLSYESAIAFRDIREFTIDRSEKGLFKVSSPDKTLLFHAVKLSLLTMILTIIERGRNLAKSEVRNHLKKFSYRDLEGFINFFPSCQLSGHFSGRK